MGSYRTEGKYIGWTLVWEDDEKQTQEEGEIYAVGPGPYVWVESESGDWGIPECDWIEVKP